MAFRTSIAVAALGLALFVLPVSAKQALPSVSAAIPVTAESRPFLGAQTAMAKVAYVEEEYFLSGTANTYSWTGEGRGVKVIAGPGKYVTRILVRRPRDAARFGGNVEVTVLNASLNVDLGGPTDFARMAKQGDVWIGITTKASTANALKKFDAVRYALLDWSNPAQPEQRCPNPTMIPPYMAGGEEVIEAMAKAGIKNSSPEYEDGLVWGMLGQLGLLLKSEQRSAILPGFAKPHVFMTGFSQSAIYIRTFVAGFHDRFRTADGRPVYNGYLAIVGPAMIRINQCARDIELDDRFQKLTPTDVPFISISSEGEMWQARHTRQPDAFTRRGGIVSYEVAGSSHSAADIPGKPMDTLMFAPIPDMMKAGAQLGGVTGAPILIPAGAKPNDLTWAPLVRGAYRNLTLWARNGVKPPQAPGITLDAKLEIARDADGNALGGLRMSYIDVPVASHTGYLAAGGMGGVTGAKRPFTSEKLSALYPDQATYAAKFAAATDQLLAGRWILPEDAEAMKAAATLSAKP
jgi:Alpha/beta hydrolase domain